MPEKFEEQMKILLEKVDRILLLLDSQSRESQRRKTTIPTSKRKPVPLGAEETARYQEQFERLFKAWDTGEELKVEKELDQMDANELRRFADANNLNVTSKTAKQKVMRLIAGRFRERRQLMRSHFDRSRK